MVGLPCARATRSLAAARCAYLLSPTPSASETNVVRTETRAQKRKRLQLENLRAEKWRAMCNNWERCAAAGPHTPRWGILLAPQVEEAQGGQSQEAHPQGHP